MAARSPSEIWRAELLARLLRWIFVIGLVVAVPSTVQAVRIGQPLVLVGDAVALAGIAALAYGRRISDVVRAHLFVALLYLFGVLLMFTLGAVAQLFLLAVPVMAAVLLSMRRAIAVLVLNAATLMIASGLLGVDLAAPTDGADVADWAVITLNFVFVSWILTYSAGRLIGRLEEALARQHAVSASLDAEQRRLSVANAELRREIVDRERAEAEARRLALAIEQSGVAVVIFDLDGIAVFGNAVHDRLVEEFGTDASFAHLPDLVERLDVTTAAAPDAFAGREEVDRPSFTGTVAFADADGRERRFVVRIVPLVEHRPVGSVAVLRDITDEVRVQERLRRSERLEALGTLASGTAHDFNNVTAAIRMIAESTGATAADPTVVDSMATIVAACDRARDVVRQMMVFGRQSALARERVTLSEVVREARPLVRAAVHPSIELRLDLDGRRRVSAHPSEIQQVLMNLVANASYAVRAADAPPPVGGHAVTVTVRDDDAVSGDQPADLGGEASDQGLVVLEVSDTGVGISVDDLERVFDPFFTTKPPGEGSGLGLASVHGLVESLGGSVAVSSLPGQGTTFTVRLPAVDGRSPVVDGPGGSEQRPATAPNEARILLVEDEEAIRSIAARHLTRVGHRVTTAHDGRDAVDRFDLDPTAFDLVVTDLAMPRLDGRSVVRHVHTVRPGLPVIVSTGFGESADAELAGLEHLAKPYSLAQLEAAVQRALAARSPLIGH